MEKINVTEEMCAFFHHHYKFTDIKVTHPDELYAGRYIGCIIEDGSAVIPFGSWIEVYPQTEYVKVYQYKEQ